VSSVGRFTLSDSTGELHFRIRPSASLYWAGWDDEYVVFDETSGQTHQLDPLRAYVLNTLTASPQSRRELMDDLQTALGESQTSEVVESLGAVLDDFDRHGLIDRISA
jgi:PqqD family protein of HPr-rel-A system